MRGEKLVQALLHDRDLKRILLRQFVQSRCSTDRGEDRVVELRVERGANGRPCGLEGEKVFISRGGQLRLAGILKCLKAFSFSCREAGFEVSDVASVLLLHRIEGRVELTCAQVLQDADLDAVADFVLEGSPKDSALEGVVEAIELLLEIQYLRKAFGFVHMLRKGLVEKKSKDRDQMRCGLCGIDGTDEDWVFVFWARIEIPHFTRKN